MSPDDAVWWTICHCRAPSAAFAGWCTSDSNRWASLADRMLWRCRKLRSRLRWDQIVSLGQILDCFLGLWRALSADSGLIVFVIQRGLLLQGLLRHQEHFVRSLQLQLLEVWDHFYQTMNLLSYLQPRPYPRSLVKQLVSERQKADSSCCSPP